MSKVPVTNFKFSIVALLLLLLAGLLTISCDRPEVIHDLSGSSYELLNEDSLSVNYPTDFKGDIQVVGFIFTNCPDICPAITANMRRIQNELQDTSDVRFQVISFDPERDTPSVLKKYKNTFQLDEQFTMLTGDTTNINAVLDELNIVAQKEHPDSLGKNNGDYNITHTNRILVMDRKGRVRFEYPGSHVQPGHVTDDIRKLQ